MSGGVSVGFRPVASGQMFQVFLPVITPSQILVGTGDNTHAFRWHTNATGVYANPGGSTVWAWTFPGVEQQSGVFVYFAREPAAVPFWKADAQASPDRETGRSSGPISTRRVRTGMVSYKIDAWTRMREVFGSGWPGVV